MRNYAVEIPPARRRSRWITPSIILLLVLVGAIGVWVNSNKQPQNPSPAQQLIPGQPDQPHITSVTGRYLFSGTVVIARAVENEARRADGSTNYDQPFSQFKTFNPKQYDAWEFDHECPMTMRTIPYRTQVANTIFNCRPEFIPAMQKHFPTIIANIANNHTQDMGIDGYKETVRLLEKGGIQTIGNYTPRATDDICEVVALPVRLKKSDNTEVKGTLPVAFCAWHYFSFDVADGEIEAMDEYAKIMPVFAFMQVGVEYRPTADPKQINIARTLIDHGGPEFVIGNSPHWVQNTEVYKGKLIVYSTGNFIFDQLDAETNRGLSIDASMNIEYDENVAKWLELGEQCKKRHDRCLSLAREQGLSKVKIQLSYEAVGSKGGYRVVTQKANASLQKAIEARANWPATLKELGQD